MIRINLLPHREAARKRRKEVFQVMLAAACLGGALLAGLVYSWIETETAAQEAANLLLQQENQRLDGQIKETATLEADIRALRARQQAVEDVQGERNLPVRLMNELVAQLPDGVYITKLVQTEQAPPAPATPPAPNAANTANPAARTPRPQQLVTINGVAQSNERVSELLRNLDNRATWFSKPELVEIVAGTMALSVREQKRIYNFAIRVNLVRPGDAPAAASPAPAKAAAATPTATANPATNPAAPLAAVASALTSAATPASGAPSAPSAPVPKP